MPKRSRNCLRVCACLCDLWLGPSQCKHIFKPGGVSTATEPLTVDFHQHATSALKNVSWTWFVEMYRICCLSCKDLLSTWQHALWALFFMGSRYRSAARDRHRLNGYFAQRVPSRVLADSVRMCLTCEVIKGTFPCRTRYPLS